MIGENELRIQGEVKQATCTQTQLGRALGVSKQRVGQLVEEKIVVRDESATNGQVMLFDSLQNYFLSKNTSGDGVNFWKEKGLHERAKRELAELKLAKSRGELYESTVVENVMIEQLANFRTKLLGLPTKYALQLEGKKHGEIYELLTAAIEECLTELAENYEAAKDDFKEEDNPIELED